jgi:hypothetical protein
VRKPLGGIVPDMKPIKSTYEILAFKVLNRSVDKNWTDWATEMLQAGFDTESLVILAGETAPFNQFELTHLTDKVFKELHLDYSDIDQVIKNYASYLIDKALSGQIEPSKVLDILKDICIERDYEKYLYDFYSLYFAKDDLTYSDDQWYWEGADKSNIDKVINDYFRSWLLNNPLEIKSTTSK